ncbi:MAG: ribonuclease P protein component, partial [Gemmatimonadetes bacterium]|nr:ribonuclease P protein component [Gemmatimonadota bacterium]
RRCGPLEVYRCDSPTRSPRAGIIVPRFGHTIVQRNRLKRRLREFVRTGWLPIAWGQNPVQEILVRARPAAYSTELGTLREALDSCLGITR